MSFLPFYPTSYLIFYSHTIWSFREVGLLYFSSLGSPFKIKLSYFFFLNHLYSFFLTLNHSVLNEVSNNIFSHVSEESNLITKTNKETGLSPCLILSSSSLDTQISCADTTFCPNFGVCSWHPPTNHILCLNHFLIADHNVSAAWNALSHVLSS